MKVYAKDGADGLKIHRDALQVIYGIEKKENLTKNEVEQPRLIEGLDQEQKLNAMNTQRILQLEERNTHKKKKSFFDFFRKGAEQ